jgi:hypothetical protein
MKNLHNVFVIWKEIMMAFPIVGEGIVWRVGMEKVSNWGRTIGFGVDLILGSHFTCFSLR